MSATKTCHWVCALISSEKDNVTTVGHSQATPLIHRFLRCDSTPDSLNTLSANIVSLPSFEGVINAVTRGEHASLVCYGANPTERQQLMIGTPESFGILPLAIAKLYDSPLLAHPSPEIQVLTSFVALSTNTIVDLLDMSNSTKVHVSLREGTVGLAGSSSRIVGAKALASQNVDDALEALDIGLESMITATEAGIISNTTATQVFTLSIHTPAFYARLQIVSVGRDSSLMHWFEDSVSDAAKHHHVSAMRDIVVDDARGSNPNDLVLGPNIDLDGVLSVSPMILEEPSFPFVPRPFHHQAATLLIPLLCQGNSHVGVVWVLTHSQSNNTTDGSGCPQAKLKTVAEESTSITMFVSVNPSSSPEDAEDCAGSSSMAGTSSSSMEDDSLPPGWEAQQTDDGRIYYVDHIGKVTTWDHPRKKKFIPPKLVTPALPTRELIVGDAPSSDAVMRTGASPLNVAPLSSESDQEVAVVVIDPSRKVRVVITSRSVSAVQSEDDEPEQESVAPGNGDAHPKCSARVDGEFATPCAATADSTQHTDFVSKTIALNDAVSTTIRVGTAALQSPGVQYYLNRPTSDEEQIESFLSELECLMKDLEASSTALKESQRLHEAERLRADGLEAQCKELKASVADRARLQVLLDQSEQRVAELESNQSSLFTAGGSSVAQRRSRSNSGIAMSRGGSRTNSPPATPQPPPPPPTAMRQLWNVVSLELQECGLFEDIASMPLDGRGEEHAAWEQSAHDRIVKAFRDMAQAMQRSAVAMKEQLARHLQASAAQTSQHEHVLQNQAAAHTEAMRILSAKHADEVTKMREALHLRHLDIVEKLCEKQKESIRRMHSDFEKVLVWEKSKSRSVAEELERSNAALEECRRSLRDEAKRSQQAVVEREKLKLQIAQQQHYLNSPRPGGDAQAQSRAPANDELQPSERQRSPSVMFVKEVNIARATSNGNRIQEPSPGSRWGEGEPLHNTVHELELGDHFTSQGPVESGQGETVDACLDKLRLEFLKRSPEPKGYSPHIAPRGPSNPNGIKRTVDNAVFTHPPSAVELLRERREGIEKFLNQTNPAGIGGEPQPRGSPATQRQIMSPKKIALTAQDSRKLTEPLSRSTSTRSHERNPRGFKDSESVAIGRPLWTVRK